MQQTIELKKGKLATPSLKSHHMEDNAHLAAPGSAYWSNNIVNYVTDRNAPCSNVRPQ